MQAEEQRRPRGIEHELKGVDGQRQRGADEPGLPPNQPAGYGDHHVENCPHWRKQAVRWTPRWLLQALVPFTWPEEGAGHGREEARGDEA